MLRGIPESADLAYLGEQRQRNARIYGKKIAQADQGERNGIVYRVRTFFVSGKTFRFCCRRTSFFVGRAE